MIACHERTTGDTARPEAPASSDAAPRADDVRAATDEVERARQEVIVAKHTLKRQQELHAQGEPQRDVDQAQSDYDAKMRALKLAEERLAKLRDQ